MGLRKPVRCAIYTRVSTDQGLEHDFNSLDAQYDAAQAYIRSQAHAGWTLLRGKYDDGGFSGGDTDRPALQRLLQDVRAGKVDVIVVYKVDRLTRSLADFAKLVELFDRHNVSFVSVTQQFNTTTSMGRLTLNVLLSFAQFERDGGPIRPPNRTPAVSETEPGVGKPASCGPSSTATGSLRKPRNAWWWTQTYANLSLRLMEAPKNRPILEKCRGKPQAFKIQQIFQGVCTIS